MALRRFRLGVWCGACLLLAASAHQAAAWGAQGHRIIALIADHALRQDNPAVHAKVAALLAGDRSNRWTKTDIADEATWADVLIEKSEEARTATMAWHYVRLNAAHPDMHRDCFGRPALPASIPASHGPQDDCVVDKIEQFKRELIDPSTSAAEQLMALRFLLNLVGDVHEPLYAIDRGDRGGACVALVLGKDAPPVRLVNYWDDALVNAAVGSDPAEGADGLAAAVAPPDAAKWAGGSVEEWARESFAVAKTVAYAFRTDGPDRYKFPGGSGRPKDDCGSVLLSHAGGDYQAKAIAAVKAQLTKAGLRLAATLRDSLL